MPAEALRVLCRTPCSAGHRDGDTSREAPGRPGAPRPRGGRGPTSQGRTWHPGAGICSVWAQLGAPFPAQASDSLARTCFHGSLGPAAFTANLSERLLPSRVCGGSRGAWVRFLGTLLRPRPEQVLELSSRRAPPPRSPPAQPSRVSFLEAYPGRQMPFARTEFKTQAARQVAGCRPRVRSAGWGSRSSKPSFPGRASHGLRRL